MADPINRVTLFVPGGSPSRRAWETSLKKAGLRIDGEVLRGDVVQSHVGAEWIENDGAFGDSFSFGTVDDGVVQAIAEAPLALVLYFPVDLREGRAEITAVVDSLRDSGALAVRLEQSRLGWEIADWLELMTSDDPTDWHRAAVVILREEGALQSCGMGAFSLPDARVELGKEKPRDLQALITALDVYQLGEDPLLLSGHTFAPDAETPRRLLRRWPDTQYPRDHACHNPYGAWRLGPPGGKGEAPSELAMVFMPSLAATLLVAEKGAGKPLTRKQVEAVRDEAACVAMDHRDAQRLERSRGYADVDPELVWEQWQVMR